MSLTPMIHSCPVCGKPCASCLLVVKLRQRDLAYRIKKWRESQNLTIEQAAKFIWCSDQAWKEWEKRGNVSAGWINVIINMLSQRWYPKYNAGTEDEMQSIPEIETAADNWKTREEAQQPTSNPDIKEIYESILPELRETLTRCKRQDTSVRTAALEALLWLSSGIDKIYALPNTYEAAEAYRPLLEALYGILECMLPDPDAVSQENLKISFDVVKEAMKYV